MGRDTGTLANTAQSVRKKTPGACERCREKRIKCSGSDPCQQCSSKGVQCVFTFGGGTVSRSEVIEEKLDLILSRMNQIEQTLSRYRMSRSPPSGQGSPAANDFQHNGINELNMHTGCHEYYGSTSSIVTISSLQRRIKHLEEQSSDRSRTKHGGGTRTSLEPTSGTDMTGFYDYTSPADAMRQPRRLREAVADRHLNNFFATIHIFLPIFDEERFRAKYRNTRTFFGDNRLFLPTIQDPTRKQFVCLLYAVLALGALYEDEQEDSSSWAAWYFTEGQDMLSRHLDAINLELVQAVVLMGAYAQHAIKPNLAYVLTGLATRLALSIGLNMESIGNWSKDFDGEEAKRTWWLIYIQEVELSLDSGRPMSIRASDMRVEYPGARHAEQDGNRTAISQVTFIRYLAQVANIIRRVLELSHRPAQTQLNRACNEAQEVRKDLKSWHTSLPTHLQLQIAGTFSPHTSDNHDPYSWQARQRSSLRIHYNLALIILLRRFFLRPNANKASARDTNLVSEFQVVCLDAARDMIKHIHQLFKLAPRLRRWSYYCFYCLQSILILLMELTEGHIHSKQRKTFHSTSSLQILGDSTESQKALSDLELCDLSIEIFEQIDLKASKRCAEVVRDVLEKVKQSKKRKRSDFDDDSQTQGSVNRESRSRQRIARSSTPLVGVHAQKPAFRHQLQLHTDSSSLGTTETDAAVSDPSSSSYDGIGESATRSVLGHPSHNNFAADDFLGNTAQSEAWSPPFPFSQLQAELNTALHFNESDQDSMFPRHTLRFGAGIGIDGFMNMTFDDNLYLPEENGSYTFPF